MALHSPPLDSCGAAFSKGVNTEGPLPVILALLARQLAQALLGHLLQDHLLIGLVGRDARSRTQRLQNRMHRQEGFNCLLGLTSVGLDGESLDASPQLQSCCEDVNSIYPLESLGKILFYPSPWPREKQDGANPKAYCTCSHQKNAVRIFIRRSWQNILGKRLVSSLHARHTPSAKHILVYTTRRNANARTTPSGRKHSRLQPFDTCAAAPLQTRENSYSNILHTNSACHSLPSLLLMLSQQCAHNGHIMGMIHANM